jgi:hypothetical protein
MNWIGRVRTTLLGSLLLACFIALLHWNTANLPLIRDEGEYAYSAWLLNHASLPYTDSFLQKPPMIVYTYWLAELVDDGTGRAARWLAVLFQLASALVLGAIAFREIGASAVWPARLLLAPLLLMSNLDQFTANTEQFMILPLLILWLLYASYRTTAGPLVWFWTGFVSAVAVLYKYTCVPIPCFIFSIWFLESCFAVRKVGRLLRSAAAALAGCLLAGGLILAPFIIHDGCRDLYECTIRFNREYAIEHQFSVPDFRANLEDLFASWWVLIFAGLLFFVLRRGTRLWFYLGLYLCALVCTVGGIYTHYYLILAPFIAFAAAGGMTFLVPLISKGCRMRLLLAEVLVCTAGVLAALYPNRGDLMTPPKALEKVKYAGFPFSESVLMGQKVAEATSPTDRVLVAGSEPQILYYAGRRSSTRFVIAYPLTLSTTLARAYQEEAVKEFYAHPPQAIVMVRNPTSWLLEESSPRNYVNYLEETLRSKYELSGGVRVAGENGVWMEAKVANNCMLLLFAKKAEPATKERANR